MTIGTQPRQSLVFVIGVVVTPCPQVFLSPATERCQTRHILLCRVSNAVWEFPGRVRRIAVQEAWPKRDWLDEEGNHRGGSRGAGLPVLGRTPPCRDRSAATCRRDSPTGRHNRDPAGPDTSATRNDAARQFTATVLSGDRSETRTHRMSLRFRQDLYPVGRSDSSGNAWPYPAFWSREAAA